jgi:hypothetical protein
MPLLSTALRTQAVVVMVNEVELENWTCYYVQFRLLQQGLGGPVVLRNSSAQACDIYMYRVSDACESSCVLIYCGSSAYRQLH